MKPGTGKEAGEAISRETDSGRTLRDHQKCVDNGLSQCNCI